METRLASDGVTRVAEYVPGPAWGAFSANPDEAVCNEVIDVGEVAWVCTRIRNHHMIDNIGHQAYLSVMNVNQHRQLVAHWPV